MGETAQYFVSAGILLYFSSIIVTIISFTICYRNKCNFFEYINDEYNTVDTPLSHTVFGWIFVVITTVAFVTFGIIGIKILIF